MFSSSHPNHNKQSIPYSQFFRLCSDDKDFETKYLEMRTSFVELELDSAIQKAFSNSRRDTPKPPLAKISNDKIPFSFDISSL